VRVWDTDTGTDNVIIIIIIVVVVKEHVTQLQSFSNVLTQQNFCARVKDEDQNFVTQLSLMVNKEVIFP